MDENSGNNNVENNTTQDPTKGFDPENQKEKKSLGEKLSPFKDGLNAYNAYKQAGSLGGMAKNLAKDAGKEKAKEAGRQLANNFKNRIGNGTNKMPSNVSNKKKEMDEKGKANRSQQKTPDDDLEKKKQTDSLSPEMRELALKKGVKTAVDIAAPGTGAGEFAEAALDTPKGRPAVEEAKTNGVKSGVQKLIQIFVSEQLKKALLTKVLPVIAAVFIIILIPIMLTKFFDSEIYFKGYAEGESTGEIVDKDYEAFYKNVEKYGSVNSKMVVAVLTAYQDNDTYGKDGDYNADCTDEELETGTCIIENTNINSKSKKQMKKYIKKVAKQIEKSGDIAEGDYDDPLNTGSEFFNWLYKDFVEDYYSEYFTNLKDEKKIKDKKDEIVSFIYLYYNELNDNDTSLIGATYSSCPNGITVIGSGTYDLDDYVAGVVAHENYTSYMESMKAQAIAARTYALAVTNNCTKPIGNSTNSQTFYPIETVKQKYPKALDAAKATSGEVLTYKGEIFASEYDSFKGTCSGDTCTATYTRIPSSEKHTVTIPRNFLVTQGGHGRGMSQCAANYMASTGSTYKDILKRFYANDVEVSTMTAQSVGDLYAFGGTGLAAESFFPISKKDIKRIYKSSGWYYGSGKYHGATDIACYWNGSAKNCHTIGIYSAHDGVVSSIGTAQCNGISTEAASKTGLPYVPGCMGTHVNVRITSGEYKGYMFLYYHLSSVAPGLKVGDSVQAGQLLGYMGNTGRSTGPHLHFQLNDPKGNRTNFNSAIDKLLASVK